MAPPKQRRRFAGFGLQRMALAALGVLGTVGLLTLAACPANLENPERFDLAQEGGAQPSGGAAPTDGGATTPGLGVDTTCLVAVFKNNSCSMLGCHGPVGGVIPPQSGLDLSSDGVNARLINVPAKHGLTATPNSCPMGDKLIDASNPSASWLLMKLTMGTAEGLKCGTTMPVGATLSAADLACVQMYVQNVAAAATAGM